MATKFGLLAKLDFLQNWVSTVIASVNPAIIHNVDKYLALKTVHYLAAIEHLEGDYLEFGVFTGSSFCHSIRCCRKLSHLNPALKETRFFGFDSFDGFGELAADEKHPFYTDENFSTSAQKVDQRAAKAAGRDFKYQLVPGYFNESLKDGPQKLNISKAKIIFIDSDTYSSAADALAFCETIVQPGTYIVLDDFFSYRGSRDKGVAKAFSEFVERCGLDCRQVRSYGMGGVVIVVAAVGADAASIGSEWAANLK